MKDLKNAISHLKTHIEYPATRQELVEACNQMSDFSEEDKMWFEQNLPDGTYDSAGEVMEALGIKEQPAHQAM